MSLSVSTNALELVTELGNIEGRVFKNLEREVRTRGKSVERLWVANATATAGAHGKWYPRAIKGRKSAALEYEIRPDPSARQGAMSFEEGSSRQKPHHDARRAFYASRGLIQYGLRRAVEQAL